MFVSSQESNCFLNTMLWTYLTTRDQATIFEQSASILPLQVVHTCEKHMQTVAVFLTK